MPKKKRTKEALSAEQIHEHLDSIEDGQIIQFFFTTGLGCVAIGIALLPGCTGRSVIILGIVVSGFAALGAAWWAASKRRCH